MFKSKFRFKWWKGGHKNGKNVHYWIGFSILFGFWGETALDETGFDFVAAAYVEVAGRDYRDLRRDRDFKKAERYVVDRYCTVYDDSISC